MNILESIKELLSKIKSKKTKKCECCISDIEQKFVEVSAKQNDPKVEEKKVVKKHRKPRTKTEGTKVKSTKKVNKPPIK